MPFEVTFLLYSLSLIMTCISSLIALKEVRVAWAHVHLLRDEVAEIRKELQAQVEREKAAGRDVELYDDGLSIIGTGRPQIKAKNGADKAPQTL